IGLSFLHLRENCFTVFSSLCQNFDRKTFSYKAFVAVFSALALDFPHPVNRTAPLRGGIRRRDPGGDHGRNCMTRPNLTRRGLLGTGAVAGAGLALPTIFTSRAAAHTNE